MRPATVAVDVAKNVFELALAGADGHLIARRRFTRRQFERFANWLGLTPPNTPAAAVDTT